MVQLLHDRYIAYDDERCWDLSTGEMRRVGDVTEEACSHGRAAEPAALAPLMEVLDHGCDGDPRWIVSDARNAAQAGAMARRAASSGRDRGFVPILVPLYLRFRRDLAEDLRDRALLLIGQFASSLSESRAALVDAAARSARPHVLLTFRSAQPANDGTYVREARAAYGSDAQEERAAPH
jgi:hypothetical protein